ncbi:MAG: hypothetical protein IJ306_08975 [Oscillospiraceae bacterium]|nr:hypothetical protein [Oscillospiraceae bacterium]
MKDWKKICKKILFPPIWFVILLSLASAAALIFVFIKGLEEHPAAYAIYAVSAYALTVFCALLAVVIPRQYKKAKNKIYAHPFGNRYMTDAAYKVRVSLYISLGLNLAYAFFKLGAGMVYSSTWLGAVGLYYAILAVMRFSLLRYMHSDSEKQSILHEYKKYRFCGILMLITNLSLSGIVFQMVWKGESYEYPGVLIFVVAAYTFYAVTISIIDIVRFRKYKSPVLSASKAIRFAAAVVSLLTLETAMLAQFGGDEYSDTLMTALTGAGVCIIVLAVSVYMIINSTKEIKKLKT